MSNKGYVQLKGPFAKGTAYRLPIDTENEKVKRVSVQLYNNWPFEAFNSSKDMDAFAIKEYDLNGTLIKELGFIIGESGTLELDELSDLKLTHFSFNKDVPASTLIEIELNES